MRHVLVLPGIVLAIAIAGTAGLTSRGDARQGAQAAVTAITGATLVDGTGRPPVADAVVIIEGDRIRAVGARAAVSVPAGATVIDGRGRTLMPGLVDLHTHLQGGWDGESGDMLNFGRYLDALLYSGVTTILDPGNSMPYVTQIRQEIAAGRLRGPRVFCAGPMKFVAGDKADWGTIEAGKRADLVLVTGRPHERIGDTRTIADVVVAGRRLDRARLRIQPGEPAYRTSGTMYNPTPR